MNTFTVAHGLNVADTDDFLQAEEMMRVTGRFITIHEDLFIKLRKCFST